MSARVGRELDEKPIRDSKPQTQRFNPDKPDEPDQSSALPNENTRTFTVLVTGMGAFPPNYAEEDNTSHLLTTYLPNYLPAFTKHNPTRTPIQILNPTSEPGKAVKAEYNSIRNYVKKLWGEYGNSVDLILHLGMADGWQWYTIEKSAWKEGTVKPVDMGNGRGETGPSVRYYMVPDNVEETYKDIPGICPWGDEVPCQLWTGPGIDADSLAKDVKSRLNEGLLLEEGSDEKRTVVEVKPHSDAGNYLCGFITYESLAQAFVNGYSAKALFCHIPGWRDRERLQLGSDFICALISQVASNHY